MTPVVVSWWGSLVEKQEPEGVEMEGEILKERPLEPIISSR